METFQFFELIKNGKIIEVVFNNDENLNAQNWNFFEELPEIVKLIDNDDDIVCSIFYSKSKHFSIGLDIFDFSRKFSDLLSPKDVQTRKKLYDLIRKMQLGMNMIEKSKKVFISAISGYCIGGALDFIAATDIRLASNDAVFSLRETKLGIVADLGSLQRLPHIIGIGNTKFLALTGTDIDAKKAKEIGLVYEIYNNKDILLENARKIANEIVQNPPEAVYGSKLFINNLFHKKTEEELDKVAIYNSSFLDFTEVAKKLEKILKKK